jgi:hypothetical protein
LQLGNGGAFSISLHVNMASMVQAGTLFLCGMSSIGGSEGWEFRLTSGTNGTPNAVQWVFLGPTDVVTTGQDIINTVSGFQHIVVTYDGTTIRIYVDNVEEASEDANAGTAATSDQFRVGIRIAAGHFLRGILDELAIWSRALSALEVAALYNAGAGVELENGGFPGFATHAALSTGTPLIAPYTDGVDNGKVAAFDGNSLEGVPLSVPTNTTTKINGVTPSNRASTWSIDVETGLDGIDSSDKYSVALDLA